MLRFVGVVFGLLLLGQGCIPRLPAIAPSTPIAKEGEPSPEGFVTFSEGFGALPGVSPSLPTATASSRMVINAAMPVIPPAVTVLREWDAAPNDTLLRNITTAVQLPPGILGATPVGESLVVRWQDEDGIQWSYDATNVLPVTFHASAMNVNRHPEAPDAIAQAIYFLSDHGIDPNGWGVPELVGQDVLFGASRDQQTVTDGRGMSVPDAVIRVGSNNTVTQGAFAVTHRLDRSNYPALSAQEILERLRRGGTHPISADRVTIDHLSIELYRHEVVINERPRIFYLPALWARGTAQQGTSSLPYETVVPLVRDEVFGGG